jgi:hypothetical protein
MLNADQLSNKVSAYVAGQISLYEFEEWFRDESEDVHLWGDQELNNFVFSVEALFSEYHFESLGEAGMRMKLQAEVRRFARPFASRSDSTGLVVCIPPRHSFAATAAVALALSAVVPNGVVLPQSDGASVANENAVVESSSEQANAATEELPVSAFALEA